MKPISEIHIGTIQFCNAKDNLFEQQLFEHKNMFICHGEAMTLFIFYAIH